jgi:hypothetical protein
LAQVAAAEEDEEGVLDVVFLAAGLGSCLITVTTETFNHLDMLGSTEMVTSVFM